MTSSNYLTWPSKFIKRILDNESNDSKINLISELLFLRGKELLELFPNYKELYIDPDSDISTKEAQIVQQVHLELMDFLKLILTHKCKNILQIGLGHFGSTHLCLSLLCDKVTTVDICWDFINRYISREITHNPNKDRFICGSSDNEDVINMALRDKSYDLLFIDANHSYEYVKNDYKNYINGLKIGGICAFHDTILNADQYGVYKLVNELRKTKNIKDIIHSKTTGISYFIKE